MCRVPERQFCIAGVKLDLAELLLRKGDVLLAAHGLVVHHRSIVTTTFE